MGGEGHRDALLGVVPRASSLKQLQVNSRAWPLHFVDGCMLAGMTFRKEPFFAGADNVDQLYKIAKVLGTDLLHDYLDAYDLELELEVEQRLGTLPRKQWSAFKTKDNAERCSPEALELIDKMLRYDPAARILPREAMQHAYFEEVRKQESNK
ncbi:CKA1 [Symbiodinium pilosum]|uniref:non-specific serine/threonine protein kinase n=1 Tax=Symbiodinium pilosum TaxID=2952 RepID=A0A812V5D6_SYMPI|nr:CKA1 [Symbiodinium pilosum]